MKKVSSYQKLKIKKAKAEERMIEALEDLEAVILYPYISRAKGIRFRIKEDNE